MGSEVGPGIHRLGGRHVNWYVVEDSGSLTVVDTGLPAYWPHLGQLISAIGIPASRIEAVLLTHEHPDHIGNAERLRSSHAVRIWAHTLAVPAIQVVDRRPPRAPLWRPRVLRYMAHSFRNGVATVAAVRQLSSFDDGEQLDVPGRPRVVHTPGHTAGHSSLFFEDRRAVFVGDALATTDIITGADRPCLSPHFTNQDSGEARKSLSRIEGLPADLVLPGHGAPWNGGIGEAVRLSRLGA